MLSTKSKVVNLAVALEDFCSDDEVERAFRGHLSGQDFELLRGSLHRVQSMVEKVLRDHYIQE